MGILVVILIVLLGVAGYAIWNLTRKLEVYEDFITSLQTRLTTTLAIIKDIDSRGAFEADDEVGSSFRDIKDAILRIAEFTGPELMSERQRSASAEKTTTTT